LRQEADRRADDPGESLYRLGLVAWACLSGESPTVGTWQDKSLAGYVRQPATPLPSLPDTVPPGIAMLAADLTTAGSPARRGGAAHVVARCGELLATPMRTRQPGRSSGPGETSLLDTLDGELRCA